MTSVLTSKSSSTWQVPAALITDVICVSVVLSLVLIGLSTPRFHSDSWSLFELSKTIFGDFYRTTTFRQFETTSLYSTAFPPLYPLLLALVRPIGGGIYAGIWLNAVICVSILAEMHRLARTLALPRWTANFTFVVMLATPGFFDDFVAARTMPLAILLFVLLINSFVRATSHSSSYWQVLFTGILSGAAVMTRFDFMLPSAAVGAMLTLAWEPSRRLRTSLIYTLGFIPLITPWILYSLAVQGHFWASDNVRTVISVHPTHVLNYVPDPSTMLTMQNAPGKWLYALLFEKAPPVAITIIRSMLGNQTLAFVGVALLLVISRRGIKESIASIPRPLLALTVPIAVQLGTIVLTGYTVPRYFTALTILITLLVLTSGAASIIEKAAPRVAFIVVAILAIFVPIKLGGIGLITSNTSFEFKQRAEFISIDQYKYLMHALLDVPNPHVLVMHNASELGHFNNPTPPPFLDPYRFGALTGIVTFPQPLNYSNSIIEPFVHRFRITHLYDTEGFAKSALMRSCDVVPTGHPFLFRLDCR